MMKVRMRSLSDCNYCEDGCTKEHGNDCWKHDAMIHHLSDFLRGCHHHHVYQIPLLIIVDVGRPLRLADVLLIVASYMMMDDSLLK